MKKIYILFSLLVSIISTITAQQTFNSYIVMKPQDISQCMKSTECYKNDDFLYTLSDSGEIIIVAYLGESVEKLIIPDKIEDIAVTAIFSLQSLNSAKFKTIVFPKSIKSIANGALVNLNIENVIFEKDSKLREIEQNAFRCNNIKELNLPKQKITIGLDAFSDNQIKKVSIYKDWSFGYKTTAGHFFLDDCVKQKENAFIQSDTLEEVIFEEGCTFIEAKIFANCKNLKKVTLPSTLKNVGACAFMNCTSLTDISFAGIPLVEVETLEDLYAKAKKNTNLTSSNAMEQFGINAAIEANFKLMTDPFSAYYSFKNCPLGLKTKSILLKMGLPQKAF